MPARKIISKRGPAKRSARKSKASSAPNTGKGEQEQSAAERKGAEREVRELVAKFSPERTALVSAMRRLLRARMPSAHEIVYAYRSWFVISFSPSGQGYEGVLAIRGDAKGVRLYFNRGKELADPEKLLTGTGTMVRMIEVETAATLSRPAVKRLMDEAIARSEPAFAAAGRGSIVIRSATK